jgi:hypothetical protein
MRNLTRLLCGALLLASISAEANMISETRDGKHSAEVRNGQVLIDGHRRWPETGTGSAEVTSPLVWSASGDAVAFATRDPRGACTLVVVLVDGQGPHTTMQWPVPQHARPARAIQWLGASRVGVGPAELDLKAVASWKVAQ